MGRALSSPKQALLDQIVAVLRDADGFPLSTHEIAVALGDRLVTFNFGTPPLPPRPACWPDDAADGGHGSAFCERCGIQHVMPVWRRYDGQAIRGLLNRAAKAGEVEKVALEGCRQFYWRREDTDR